MNLLLLILAVTVLTGLAWTGAHLVDVVRNDRVDRRRTPPPPSRLPDVFDPRRAA